MAYQTWYDLRCSLMSSSIRSSSLARSVWIARRVCARYALCCQGECSNKLRMNESMFVEGCSSRGQARVEAERRLRWRCDGDGGEEDRPTSAAAHRQ